MASPYQGGREGVFQEAIMAGKVSHQEVKEKQGGWRWAGPRAKPVITSVPIILDILLLLLVMFICHRWPPLLLLTRSQI